LCGAAPTLSMVGFGKIGQLEKNRERFREPGGFGDRDLAGSVSGRIERRCVTTSRDGKFPQAFDDFEEPLAFLFFDDLPEKKPERSNIAA
jgi:hypothetical protein